MCARTCMIERMRACVCIRFITAASSKLVSLCAYNNFRFSRSLFTFFFVGISDLRCTFCLSALFTSTWLINLPDRLQRIITWVLINSMHVKLYIHFFVYVLYLGVRMQLVDCLCSSSNYFIMWSFLSRFYFFFIVYLFGLYSNTFDASEQGFFFLIVHLNLFFLIFGQSYL